MFKPFMRTNTINVGTRVSIFACFATFLGCGMGSGGSSSPARGSGTTPGGTGSGAIGDPTIVGTGSGPGAIQAGTLTAGAWDDNMNFDFFLKYLNLSQTRQIPGLPLIPRSDRLEILVVDSTGAPVPGATVTISGATGKLFEAPSHPDGRMFFLPGWMGATTGDSLRVTATLDNVTTNATLTAGNNNLLLTLPGITAPPPSALELALVIDTTGSMGDEMDYLKVELADISRRIAGTFPGVEQRWALIVYKDDGDAYVVRKFDFTTSLTTFQSQLGAQSAGGGGDYPEAPDRALAQLATLQWSTGSVARMAFWVADAPHHVGKEKQLVAALAASARLGVAIYPIAASGVDALAEFSMRTAAQVTGGRYLFLTDDSGIGLSHQEPTIPCYVVTTLARTMLRMVSMEIAGADIQPATADVIRTGGNPQNRRCTLADGAEVGQL